MLNVSVVYHIFQATGKCGGVFVGLIVKIFVEGALEIGDEAALTLAGKAVADGSVKAHAEGAEEGHSVGGALVTGHNVVFLNDLERAVQIYRYAYVTREAVARAHRHDADGRVSAHQR